MRTTVVLGMLLGCLSVANAEVKRRTYKSLGDAVFVPTEGQRSCGKEPRDAIRNAVKVTRTVTVSATHLRGNDGEPQRIRHETDEAVIALSSWPAPTKAHPNRVITMALGILNSDDNVTFMMMRSAESDGVSCTDTYTVSIE